MTEEQASIHEIYIISVFGRKNNGTGILRNLTDGGEGFSSTAMKEFWEKRRQKKLNEWRENYDKNMEWRNSKYEFFNLLIQSVIINRNHVYNYDTNSIHTRVIKDRQSQKIINAWLKIHSLLKVNGHEPQVHILDNECSCLMKEAFQKHGVKYQLVPPYTHRRNAAERVIQTWKYHFLAGFASCDPCFPIREWDRLLEQGEIALNLLRSS